MQWPSDYLSGHYAYSKSAPEVVEIFTIAAPREISLGLKNQEVIPFERKFKEFIRTAIKSPAQQEFDVSVYKSLELSMGNGGAAEYARRR